MIDMKFSVLNGVSKLALVAALSLCVAWPAQAADDTAARKGLSLYQALSDIADSHDRVKAAQDDLAAAKEEIEVEWGAWYPDLDISSYWGTEQIRKREKTADTIGQARNSSLSLTQQLWDFGSANASIRKAEMAYDQARVELQAARQGLMLEGATAYLNLVKAAQVLDFAKASEANIKRQTELENALVERGSGFSTDVLQAKSQLAGAQARRVRAEGTLRNAVNRYRRIFGEAPADLEMLKAVPFPDGLLPASVEDAVDEAMTNNTQLRAGVLGTKMAQEDTNVTLADEFFPVVEGIAEWTYKNEDGGTMYSQYERIVKVEMSYDFDLGLTARNSLRASEFAESASVKRYNVTRDRVEEVARNAWDSLMTSRENAQHLRNQANIAAEFLELARKERQLGRRSLIDVLREETTLINAQSDATGAEIDAVVSGLTLLNAMGKLDLGMFQ